MAGEKITSRARPSADESALDLNLDPDRREIRLFKIVDGRPADPHLLEVTLRIVPLDESPDFVMLSYYGDYSRHKEIMHRDGRGFEIVPQLGCLLRSLRDDRGLAFDWFWVDTLCIHQQNLAEKAYQVALMAEIISQARLTISWPEVEISESTATLLEYLSPCGHQLRRSYAVPKVLGLLQNDTRITAESLDQYQADYRVVVTTLSTAKSTGIGCHDQVQAMSWRRLSSSAIDMPCDFDEQRTFAELNHLLDSKCFSRLWILQEIVRPSRLLLRCGSVELDWDMLCDALGAMIMYGTHAELKSAQAEHVLVANLLRSRYHSRQLSLSEALLAVRSCEFGAAQDHDHVYALYALSRSDRDGAHEFPFDYTADTLPLYQATSAYLAKSFDAPIFLALSGPPNLYDHPGVLSWVPRYDRPRQRMVLAHPNCSFLASPSTYVNSTNETRWLECRGCFIDEVVVVKSYLPPRRICDQYDVTGDNLFEFVRWYHFASGGQNPPVATYPNDLLVAFAETIQARGCNHIWENAVPASPAETASRARVFLQYLMDPDAPVTTEIRLFYAACLPSHDRRFGQTVNGRMCLLPPEAAKGDLVCLIRGSQVPVLLRKSETYYENVGECYVHGIMHGELEGMAEDDIVLG
ncbi:hypothetical protein LTR17_013786 [Elasticomyces elasticus]|nr:hypothetical protein LTR17_013786 [Elasticomyces elasticus]